MGVFCTQDPRGHYLPSPGPDLILGARRSVFSPFWPAHPTLLGAPLWLFGARWGSGVPGGRSLRRLGPSPCPRGELGAGSGGRVNPGGRNRCGGRSCAGESGSGFSEPRSSPDQLGSRLFVAWQPAEPMGGASAGRGGMGVRRGRRREAGRSGWRLRGAAGRAGSRCVPPRVRARGLREARAAPGAVTVSGGIVTRRRGGRRAGRGLRHRGRLSACSARPLRRLESVAARRLQREVRGRSWGAPAPLRDVTRARAGSARRAGSAISQRRPQDLARGPPRLLQGKVLPSGPAPRLRGRTYIIAPVGLLEKGFGLGFPSAGR